MNIPQPEQPAHSPFDTETWALLPDYFAALPNPVRLHIWADPQASLGEREAVRLGQALSERFDKIEMAVFPRRMNYAYYPVIGVFGIENEDAVDYGVRLIGLPAGFQMTSLIAAIQAVAFQGVTLEPATRIKMRQLAVDVRLELLTAGADEAGTLLAKIAFGLAVASPFVRTFLIMADVFPEVSTRYSVKELPHLVINGSFHSEAQLDEQGFLRQIARAVS